MAIPRTVDGGQESVSAHHGKKLFSVRSHSLTLSHILSLSLSLSLSNSLSHSHASPFPDTGNRSFAHKFTFSRSLSLSLSHTHTHLAITLTFSLFSLFLFLSIYLWFNLSDSLQRLCVSLTDLFPSPTFHLSRFSLTLTHIIFHPSVVHLAPSPLVRTLLSLSHTLSLTLSVSRPLLSKTWVFLVSVCLWQVANAAAVTPLLKNLQLLRVGAPLHLRRHKLEIAILWQDPKRTSRRKSFGRKN